ncbi:uncharacterized protein C12orf54 homolog isoform X6 [Tamandua tetradactyla]|uniref:uncharacterized protein C12orf54 homolog isoform X6 n=1 Tax=Tamandua tetradactyla TaxID=48850 RepID=UPI0040548C65
MSELNSLRQGSRDSFFLYVHSYEENEKAEGKCHVRTPVGSKDFKVFFVFDDLNFTMSFCSTRLLQISWLLKCQAPIAHMAYTVSSSSNSHASEVTDSSCSQLSTNHEWFPLAPHGFLCSRVLLAWCLLTLTDSVEIRVVLEDRPPKMEFGNWFGHALEFQCSAEHLVNGK